MRVEVFAVFDAKAKAFMQPFYAHSSGIAMRMMVELVASPGTTVNKYPEDFTLYHLASFDDQTGEFKSVIPPENLGIGTSFAELRNAT